ncbi:hypothetical protein JIN77_16880 [Verrucomicrobiaceae bacterium R5-34]|nr:hypothetical protein [Verrucomicrobiaceae bacterium R5-34]
MNMLQITLKVIGAVLGFFVAAYGTYYGCMVMDKIEGKAPQDGFMAVGWIFWFVTVPLGVIGGIKLGGIIFAKIQANKSRDSDTVN